MPTLTFHVTKAGKIKLVHGPRTFRPGRVAFKVTSQNPGAALGFARLAKHYTYKTFRHDLVGSLRKNNLKGLKRLMSHTTMFGGAGAIAPGGVAGTVVLPKAGTYTVFNSGNLPKRGLTLHAVGSPVKRTMPKTTGTIKALSGIRWGGASSLAHKGSLVFKNAAGDSPHFLELDQVQPGTTKQDILDYFQSGSDQPPSFFIAPGLVTDVVSPHRAMTVKYNLPAGTYAELCFFPDAKMGGMPHAMMGMIRIITLK
jgi:hypothetical protein